MIDVLAQIGGPVAEVALANVLQSTADPKEIALVSQYLDRLNPGVHQQETVNAARQALDGLAQGNLANRDAAPLFEVLQQYGGPAVAIDLERYAKRWNYYASIVLGQLPEGQGIPSLIALTQQGNNPAVLQMLAQAATQSPDARTALLDQARRDKLSAVTWATLVPILAGNQTFFQDSSFGSPISKVYPGDLRSTYLSSTRQSFFTAPPGAMTLDQIDRQNALIDELLGATSNPAAVQALQQSKALLAQRMPQVATTGK